MFKINLFAIFLMISGQVMAAEYKCFSIDDNEPYGINQIQLTTHVDTVEFRFNGFKNPETYKVVEQSPKTIKMEIIGRGSNSYGEGPLVKFFGDKELMTGGYPLKNGKLGGFIKVSGLGYSWAKYLCVNQ